MNGPDLRSNFLFRFAPLALLSLTAGLCVCAEEPSDPAEMAELARRYQNGLGCPRDIGRALLYYKRAASDGEPTAMLALGDLYHEGQCVPQDLRYAMQMYRQSAEAG